MSRNPSSLPTAHRVQAQPTVPLQFTGLWLKLAGAFVLVIALGVTLTTILARQATATEFRYFMFRGGMGNAGQMRDALASYYAQHGSWTGVEDVFEPGMGPPGMMGRQGRGPMGPMMGSDIALADASGRIVYAPQGGTGRQVSPAELADGLPIVVNGQRVGTLLGGSEPLTAQDQLFLDRVNRAILVSGLAAGALALVLGALLAGGITAPLRRLTAAAEAIARGDLSQRVPPGPRDEIGILGEAFNRMASSLEQAEELRRQMVADIAHELRTPLTVIQGQVEALLDGVFPADSDHIRPIHEETLLLKRLVDDLRTLALADAGQLELTPAPVDVAGLVQRALDRFEPQAAEKGVTLKAELAPNLPPAELDAQRMDQVLGILLDNALRHTPAGGRISLSAGLHLPPSPSPLPTGLKPETGEGGEDHWLCLSITDTGPGIPAEDLPHIFDRFWRGEKSRSRAGGGSGLGLAIARQLVEAHGGHIRAESPPGRGATFVIELPVRAKRRNS